MGGTIVINELLLTLLKFKYATLFLALALAAFIDFHKAKIPNLLTFPLFFFALGLACVGCVHFNYPLIDSFSGLLLMTLVFFPLFVFRVMGAGDVKLMMGVGLFLSFTEAFALLEYILGVTIVGALIIVTFRGRLSEFTRQIFLFVRSVFNPGLEIQWPKLDDTSRAPFGVAIFSGYLLWYFLR